MNKKKKDRVEFRYYEIPGEAPFLVRQGAQWRRIYGMGVPNNHFHNVLEIGCCHLGVGALALGEDRVAFDGGMVSVIPPGFLHDTVSESNVEAHWEYLFVDVERFFKEIYWNNPQTAKELAEQVHKGVVLFTKEKEPDMFFLVNEMLRQCMEKKELYMDSVKGMLLTFLIGAVRANGMANGKESAMQKGNARIAPALFHINDYYAGELKIAELAQVCHMSETHFRRIFVESMNMSPVEYRNLVRVHMACELMNKTEGSMEEIAQKVGFETMSTFNRNFKKLLGTSPYQWKTHPQNYEHKLTNFHVTAHRGW